MSEPKDLVLINEQLRRSRRFWKVLALAVFAPLIVAAIGGFVVASRAQIQAERERRAAADAHARAEVAAAALSAAHAVNPGQPR